MEKIKILHFITGLDVGGAETLLYNLIKNIDPSKFEMSVCYFKSSGQLHNDLADLGIEVFALPSVSEFSLIKIFAFWNYLRKSKFDILHNHLIHSVLIGRIIGKLAGIKIIVSTEHNLTNWGRKLTFVHLFYKLTSVFDNKIIAISNAVKSCLVTKRGISDSKIEVIFNGIDLNKFNSSVSQVELCKESFPVIGCVSRLSKIKGQNYIIEAVAKLKGKYPDILLILIGDGESRNDLQNQAKRLSLENNIRFEGTHKNIIPYLSQMDIFILASIDEGLSIALIEAMAMGKKIIATDIGGIPEVIEHMKEGILVPIQDSESIFNAINQIIDDPELSLCLQKNAIMKAQNKFDLSKMMHKQSCLYIDLYNKKIVARL